MSAFLLLLLTALLHGAPCMLADAACPAACGVCPPPGFTGACCHGNKTCETINWTPTTCTPAFGTWCTAPTPAPTPGPPTPSPGPLPPPLIVNYLVQGLPAGPLNSTHLILSFIEPSTPTIPGPGDNAWVKYSAAEWMNLTAPARSALLAALHAGGTQLMASLGGSAASHGIYTKYDPGALGARAAAYVVELGLDGIDIDLEGWGNDPNAFTFLKAVTAGARAYFNSSGDGRAYIISHAPEMPDYWHGVDGRGHLYSALMADSVAFSQIDFFNVQFYNQIPYPSTAYLFTENVYDPSVDAPSCLRSIAVEVANMTGGRLSWAQVNNKLLLGFPCKDGSLPVGSANLNQCDGAQFAAVEFGVKAGYPLRGVFEWTAASMAPGDLAAWNKGMRAALGR